MIFWAGPNIKEEGSLPRIIDRSLVSASRDLGVNPGGNDPGLVHFTYVAEKLLSGFSTRSYMWSSF